MELDGGSLVELISGALYKKHAVEVCPSAFFFYGSRNSEKDVVRQSLVRNLIRFHRTQFSDTICVQLQS
jgi:hypothetical protein